MLVFTDQHPALDPGEFGLKGYTSVRLGGPGDEDPHRHVQKVSDEVLRQLRPKPDLLVVQGDTSSALGAALAGFLEGVPVAHVEAGLRTHDPLLPWPEEEYRIAIDAQAELLFAPTKRAAANLRSEGVAGEVHVTGNTGIDAVLAAQSQMRPSPSMVLDGRSCILVTCHRRESWGEGLRSIAAALAQIAHDRIAEIDFILPPNRHVAATVRQLLDSTRGISLIPPCRQRELVERMRYADLILSDSGGIQEEAAALGAPLLILRDKTERPECIDSGNARLVGTSTERIVAEVRRLFDKPSERLAMARPAFPFGDGRAGERIAGTIVDWLERKSLTHRRT